MAIYLVTYKPLCRTATGRVAVARLGHAPFVDGSCRREPDFESQWPSISAVCRGKNLAPRLRDGDIVVYMTCKTGRSRTVGSGWRLVAALQVARRFSNHSAAAAWYMRQGLEVPSNCMVEGNAPLDLEHTARSSVSLTAWDAVYRRRVATTPYLLACVPLFLELNAPPLLTPDHMGEVLGTYCPHTRTPKVWPEAAIARLLAKVGGDFAIVGRGASPRDRCVSSACGGGTASAVRRGQLFGQPDRVGLRRGCGGVGRAGLWMQLRYSGVASIGELVAL